MKALLLALLLGLAPALAAENAWEPKPRSRWYPWMSLATWAAKHNATLVRAREGKVDLLFLGDSITEGWSDTSVWQKHYARRNAANFGIGGDTTQNLLWRIENGALERISPKVVVLLIGTNNLGLSGDAPNDVVKGCTAVVSSIRRRLPQSKVLLVGILPRDEYPNTSFRKAIATVNQHISKLNDGQSIRFLDIGNKFYPPPPPPPPPQKNHTHPPPPLPMRRAKRAGGAGRRGPKEGAGEAGDDGRLQALDRRREAVWGGGG